MVDGQIDNFGEMFSSTKENCQSLMANGQINKCSIFLRKIDDHRWLMIRSRWKLEKGFMH
jgi:hypothetical protein